MDKEVVYIDTWKVVYIDTQLEKKTHLSQF